MAEGGDSPTLTPQLVFKFHVGKASLEQIKKDWGTIRKQLEGMVEILEKNGFPHIDIKDLQSLDTLLYTIKDIDPKLSNIDPWKNAEAADIVYGAKKWISEHRQYQKPSRPLVLDDDGERAVRGDAPTPNLKSLVETVGTSSTLEGLKNKMMDIRQKIERLDANANMVFEKAKGDPKFRKDSKQHLEDQRKKREALVSEFRKTKEEISKIEGSDTVSSLRTPTAPNSAESIPFVAASASRQPTAERIVNYVKVYGPIKRDEYIKEGGALRRLKDQFNLLFGEGKFSRRDISFSTLTEEEMRYMKSLFPPAKKGGIPPPVDPPPDPLFSQQEMKWMDEIMAVIAEKEEGLVFATNDELARLRKYIAMYDNLESKGSRDIKKIPVEELIDEIGLEELEAIKEMTNEEFEEAIKKLDPIQAEQERIAEEQAADEAASGDTPSPALDLDPPPEPQPFNDIVAAAEFSDYSFFVHDVSSIDRFYKSRKNYDIFEEAKNTSNRVESAFKSMLLSTNFNSVINNGLSPP